MMTTPEISSWTHPRTGEVRRYLGNWPELVGLGLEFYGTGNISDAWIEASPTDDVEGGISNARGGATRAGKVWLDSSGTLRFSGHTARSALTVEQKRARLVAALSAHEIEAR